MVRWRWWTHTNCKIDQYPFEIPSVLFNQAHWWILLLISELGVVFAARKLRLVISFVITILRWRRSFHATLALKNTIWEQDWKITSKENIKTSSLPFPSFVISVRRLLKQKVECLNTRPTCTEWPGHPCRVSSVRKPLKRSLLLWNTHQHFIGSLSATSVLKNWDQGGRWRSTRRENMSMSSQFKLLASPREKTQFSRTARSCICIFDCFTMMFLHVTSIFEYISK